MLFVRLCSGELVYSSNARHVSCMRRQKVGDYHRYRREERVSWLAVSEL